MDRKTGCGAQSEAAGRCPEGRESGPFRNAPASAVARHRRRGGRAGAARIVGKDRPLKRGRQKSRMLRPAGGRVTRYRSRARAPASSPAPRRTTGSRHRSPRQRARAATLERGQEQDTVKQGGFFSREREQRNRTGVAARGGRGSAPTCWAICGGVVAAAARGARPAPPARRRVGGTSTQRAAEGAANDENSRLLRAPLCVDMHSGTVRAVPDRLRASAPGRSPSQRPAGRRRAPTLGSHGASAATHRASRRL